MQETFVIAIQGIEKLQDDGALQHWIAAILKNVCRRHNRRLRVQRQIERDTEHLVSLSDEERDTRRKNILVEVAVQGVNELLANEKPDSVRCKTFKYILTLLEEGRPVPSAWQMAEDWKCSLGAAKTRWHDALTRIAERCIRRLKEYDC